MEMEMEIEIEIERGGRAFGKLGLVLDALHLEALVEHHRPSALLPQQRGVGGLSRQS